MRSSLILRLSPSMLLRQASSSRGRNFLAGIGFLALSSLTAYACPPVQATVRSGQQSVKGAFVVLFAAGSGGYGSSPTVLDLGYTDANGNVKLLKNYTCPGAPRDQLYLVAEGGTFGVGYNHNRSLMAGLGTCGSWVREQA